MYSFFSKLFSKPSNSVPSLEEKNKVTSENPNKDIEMANKLRGLVSNINNNSIADKISSLEKLKQEGFITEDEFRNARKSLIGQ